eukprot:SAG31_NODE_621_length_13502_cov_18.057002_7_plen_62_part_00
MQNSRFTANHPHTAQINLLEHVYTWEGEVIEIIGDGKYWNHARTGQNTGNHPVLEQQYRMN